ncbi:hypothetical protein [Photorhabdus bodei]|uniref:Uncharacterized protein n=1 Tax=Photorhabdus bodei TaxID=2029681 RepID=A0ABX0AWV2_9GAMM|nr:hypothetical protein [Photorhabdus bodei]NDL00872.1 hypothetical protein [Photorhabdus bodei]NDL05040.1 hypothetical protein [Photorhabdus bodei]NDL09373.1 hypothetical protein [Photorhabdus bodei]
MWRTVSRVSMCCEIRFIPYGFQDASRRLRERIPGSIDNDVTGVSECSQQRGNLKDDGYSSDINHICAFALDSSQGWWFFPED